MTPRWEGLPCVCVREGFKRLEDESTSVVGHTHTHHLAWLRFGPVWGGLRETMGGLRPLNPSWVPAQGGEMVLKS